MEGFPQNGLVYLQQRHYVKTSISHTNCHVSGPMEEREKIKPSVAQNASPKKH
jgi:hypothetical protein